MVEWLHVQDIKISRQKVYVEKASLGQSALPNLVKQKVGIRV
jgi:hypothetical protein